MHDVSHDFDVFHRIRSFHLNGHSAGFGQNQMRFDVIDLGQDLDNSNSINRARGAGYPDNESSFIVQLKNSSVSGSPSRRPNRSFSRTGATTSILSVG